MGNKEALQLFGEKRIRTAWNREEESLSDFGAEVFRYFVIFVFAKN